jgi:hypothetical protein
MSLYPYNAGWPATIGSEAAPVDRGFIAHFEAVPDAVDADGLLDNQATSNTVVTVATTFLAQPPVPATITVLPGGTTNSVPAGDVTIVGTDIAGNEITATVTFLADATTAQETTYAFASVTSVTFPVQDGTGATYDVGWGKKIGLPHKLPHSTLLFARLDNAADTGTITAHATVLARNVFAINGTPDAVKPLDVYYVV